MLDYNLKQLIDAARHLRPLLNELVFVGGSVTGLLITDEAAGAPRTTFDVDAIAEITSYAQYAEFGERLRALGFAEDTSIGAPICRWVHQRTILDLMPLDENILGFSNCWYRAALEAPVAEQLSNDLWIRIVSAPLFIATKLEALKGRGKENLPASHDLEDLISVVDGRSTITEEVQATAPEVRAYIRAEITALLSTPAFIDAMPGFLLPDAISQSRIGGLLRRLNALTVR